MVVYSSEWSVISNHRWSFTAVNDQYTNVTTDGRLQQWMISTVTTDGRLPVNDQ